MTPLRESIKQALADALAKSEETRLLACNRSLFVDDDYIAHSHVDRSDYDYRMVGVPLG
jgi:hypothetical protein